MTTFVAILLVVGLLLLAFEVVVPGAILGLIGGFFLFGAVVLAFLEGGYSVGLQVLAISLAGVALMLWLEFYVLPRTRFGKRMFLDAAIVGTSQGPDAQSVEGVLGREAIALTALAPTGMVRVDNRTFEARCESGFANEGARLRVTRVETFQLVVIVLN